MPGQPATPATEEIPTKPPVAATPGIALEGAPVDGGLPAENAEVDAAPPSGPGTVDMVLSIVAALVSIALLVLVVLKVNGLVNP